VREKANEHLDNPIRGSANSLAGRLYDISRGRRTDSHPSRARRNLFDPAFCDGSTDSMSGVRAKKPHQRTGPKTQVPIRSSTKPDTLGETKRVKQKRFFGAKYPAIQHLPKHVQRMVENYKSQAKKRTGADSGDLTPLVPGLG
jgi:hypothetical protein